MTLAQNRWSINVQGHGEYEGGGRREGNNKEPRRLNKANKKRACEEDPGIVLGS